MNHFLSSKIILALFFTGFFALIGCKSSSNSEPGSMQVKDLEGNSYDVVQIGDQYWMAENLRSTTFSDGSPIKRVEAYDEWAELEIPAYSWYNNDSSHSGDFGALYNFHAVETGKLCPEGWHVPTDEDWIALESGLGGAAVAGGSLKEEGTGRWKTPNTLASNESKFTALPGGYRSYNGTFNLMRIDGFWWTSSEKNWYGSKNTVVYRNLKYDGPDLFREVAVKSNGFSIRCLKNP